MAKNLTLKIDIRQTIIGKVLMALNVPALLGRLGVMDFESARIMMLKTFQYRIGSGEWRPLGVEYYISIKRQPPRPSRFIG